jgi:hypothetical protein
VLKKENPPVVRKETASGIPEMKICEWCAASYVIIISNNRTLLTDYVGAKLKRNSILDRPHHARQVGEADLAARRLKSGCTTK